MDTAARARADAFNVTDLSDCTTDPVERIPIQTLASFTALRELAPCLDSARAGGDLFNTIEWFEVLAEHGFETPPRLHLILAGKEGASTCFCLPLIDGRTLSSLSNCYSSLYGPIGETRNAPFEVWREICGHLRRDASHWPVVDLEPLDAGSPFCRDMLAALRAEGYLADTYFRFGNWYLQVAGRSFEAYAAGLPSRLRNTIERGRRKLEREGQWSLTIHQRPNDDLEDAIAAFETVYRHSWKQPEAQPRFIARLCRIAAARGWLRLGIVRLGGEAIAAQIWFVKDGKALIYKLAYTQAHSRYSAGSLLTAALMQHVIDSDGVDEVDYLTGDDAYKRDWMSHRRERIGIVAFNPATMRGLLAAGRHFAGKAMQCLRTKTSPPASQCGPLPSSPT